LADRWRIVISSIVICPLISFLITNSDNSAAIARPMLIAFITNDLKDQLRSESCDSTASHIARGDSLAPNALIVPGLHERDRAVFCVGFVSGVDSGASKANLADATLCLSLPLFLRFEAFDATDALIPAAIPVLSTLSSAAGDTSHVTRMWSNC
jgi:hypothetical protein